jgi:alkylation response protein AidB-like acyl-CoA dehydrogenase
MDLTFTDEQQLLRDTVRALMERYSTPATVRELEDDPVGYREDLWAELGTLDLIALSASDELALETAIVHEEFGRALCSSPHLVTAVVGARLAPGTSGIVTCAWAEPYRSFDDLQMDGRLKGQKIFVPFARSASAILTVTRDGVYRVDPADVTIVQELTMASDASYRVVYDGARGEHVADQDEWRGALDTAWVAIAAYAVGGARRAHELAVAYAKERVQFDKPIGSFQGIAHPLADTATEIEGAATLVYEAAWALARGEAGPLPAMAKLYACDVFKRTTKVGMQVFGGIGFTREIDMQLYFRRAKQLELLWGDPRYLEAIIAAAELDAPEPFVHVDAGI